MGQDTESVVELVEVIAKSLVDEPDEVFVEAVDGSQSCVVELSVHPSDLGKVIGKRGRTAKSIRTLLGAVSMKYNHRYTLQILEDARPEVVHTKART